MFAPRQALLVHSVNDSIFRPEFMRPALYDPARRVYEFLGVGERIGFYANEDPGTHNYERDIREQFYAMLRKAWALDIPTADIPCEDEIRSEWELAVGLPPENPTFASIALGLARNLPCRRASAKARTADRKRLAEVLRLPAACTVTSVKELPPRRLAGVTSRQHVLELGRWRLPVTEFCPASCDGGVPLLLVADSGRARLAEAVRAGLMASRRVFAADLFSFGEQIISKGEYHYLFMECVAAAGDRPLGLCTAQLVALLRWVRAYTANRTLDLTAGGLNCGLTALCAAALEPAGLGTLRLDAVVPDSLRRLIEWQVDYVQNPIVFCFGLLAQFDIQDLVTLSAPVRIEAEGRGPLSA
jgi:hypothetical protein